MTREEELGIIIDGIENLDNAAMEIAGRNGILSQSHYIAWKAGRAYYPDCRNYWKCEVELKNRALIAMCADNGVVEEGVTQTGQEVTAIVAENFLKGATSAAIMVSECRGRSVSDRHWYGS